MKTLLPVFFICLNAINAFAIVNDSIPNWNFYYNKQVILEGSSTGKSITEATIELEARRWGEIVATFSYDVASQYSGKLEIREGERVVTTIVYDSNPSGIGSIPSVKTGSHFVIPVKQIIEFKSAKKVTMDFYYSDDKVKDLKVGSISFVLAK